MCNNGEHACACQVIDKLYNSIINILSEAAVESSKCSEIKRKFRIVGWNKHIQPAHRLARHNYQVWLSHGKPPSGVIFENMASSRRIFKSKLRWCQNNQDKIKMNILASNHTKKNFKSFWRQTKKLNPRPCIPINVEGIQEPAGIANMFRENFLMDPLSRPSCVSRRLGSNNRIPSRTPAQPIRFTAKEVSSTIRTMTKGKSPGHDGISIEHLRYAGSHLPRVLSLLYTLCIRHTYLPGDCMKTVVVPVIKNKTGDSSSKANYRPISLATTIAKVLDSLLDQYLVKHLKLHDAQFGFRAGLSTETAIFCLKQTVKYYTDRNTPVYACFLDLSKAFDMVPYEVLLNKLLVETDLPIEIVNIFDYWYNNQMNTVKWSGALSRDYKLRCGVRQGGLTSPRLFNLYINQLIEELSSTNVGCSMGGVMMNNISYADDMVLLSPSISGLRKLLGRCEAYAEAQGLRYNSKKSELLVFQPREHKVSTIPPVLLNEVPLVRVQKFKYLGHWVTDTLADDADIERERRALAVRGNMIARRFARCTAEVKVTLFKAYCQSFYTCNLWAAYTQRAINALRVQYNNIFRILLGLPRYCSASGMFAEMRTDGFNAILRKKVASLMQRVRGSDNGLLRVLTDNLDGLMRHWIEVHIN